MGTDAGSSSGSGWITYSGIMLIIAGAASIVDAIWAFRYDETVGDLVAFEDDLAVWAWWWLILGAVLVIAGVAVFKRAQWARWLGVIFAGVAVVSNLGWAQIQPTQGLIGAILAGLVVYGLAVHGDR
jgi:hypothetical protein